MNETSPITDLKGVGEKTARLFERIGVTNIGELLHYFPRGYEKFGEIQPISTVKEGETVVVYGRFQKPLSVQRIRKLQITSGIFSDESGSLRITWFNMP